MLVRLPRTLHYPITITELLRRPEEDVQQTTPLFLYSYKTTVTETNRFGEEKQFEKTFPSQFESPVEGKLTSWKVQVGTVLTSSSAVAEIEEPCSHPVQFAGLCTICGKDMTEVSYNTEYADTERAQITMIHDQVNLTVSLDEAARVEEEAKRRLLSARKLSLVVDLDQTIIHATVDPTVAEWQRDKSNPNYPAVKDVRSFQLMDDGPGGGGCWYYIKLRPGLADFLDHIAELYELHIYTMGTRAYAQAIAKIVDPDGKIFGDRILSRDESGSMTTKNLKRLFPTDTKMVIIIDDRGDVWKWSENLIKVKPYDFFVGIGDINSSFLPKAQIPPPSELPPVDEKTVNGDNSHDEQPNGADNEDGNPPDEDPSSGLTALEQLVSMSNSDDPTLLKVQADQRNEAIEAQRHDRPLQRQQEQLEAEEAKVEEEAVSMPSKPPSESGRPRHNLLRDDDDELVHLESSLTEVHSTFYDEYDQRIDSVKPSRVAELRDGPAARRIGRGGDGSVDLRDIPDVTTILPAMKARVLEGTVLVFSGLVPLGQDVQRSDIASWARSFGAKIYEDISKAVTHVVAARARTSKVRQAARYKKIKIVNASWLFDSLSQWRRLNERPYLIPLDEDDARNGAEPDWTRSMLSSSEDEASNSILDFDNNGGAVNDPEGVLPSTADDLASPVDGMRDFDWSQTNEELADFLGSDAEDSDEDSVILNAAAAVSSGTRPDKGGKRSRSSSPAGPREDEDVEMSDEPGQATVVVPPESRLAKRQKMARNRTTSLRAVTSMESLSQGDDPSKTSKQAQKADDEDEFDSDAFEREFEAEMEATSRENSSS